MQYINFIRDISEDIMLGRTYFPRDDLEKFNLESLSEDHTRSNPKNFIRFLNKQLETYGVWQNEAEAGFKYIPYRCLIPIKTASDMTEAGVDAIINICPFCHLQFDVGQKEVNKKYGTNFQIPVFHLAQLYGLAMGLKPEDLTVDAHQISTDSAIAKLDVITGGE